MSKFTSVPAYSIPKSKKNRNHNDIPGPGHYKNNTYKISGMKGIGMSFKKSFKNQLKLTELGPGKYDLNLKGKIKGYYSSKKF